MRVASPIPHKKARIEIIPLIDIMFFLLASFMMVSLSQVHMKGIKVNLPSGVSGETQTKREYLSVSVDKNGKYFDKDEMSSDEQLLNLLKMAHQSSPDAKVFVRGDKDSVHLQRGPMRWISFALLGYYKISFEIKSESLKGVPGGRHHNLGMAETTATPSARTLSYRPPPRCISGLRWVLL